MKNVCLVLALVWLAAGTGCRRADVRAAAIYVPDADSAACMELVLAGVQDTGVPVANCRVTLEAQTVEVRYDSLKLSLKNIEHAIAGRGFRANDVPADPEARARLPEPCR